MYNKSMSLFSVAFLVSMSFLPGCKRRTKKHSVDIVKTTTIVKKDVIIEHSLPTATDFRLQDESGRWRMLSEFKGKKVALVFYPLDGTPVCTAQACNLRDHLNLLKDYGITVVGISVDPWQRHAEFKREHKLNYTLLSDPHGEVAKTYGIRNWLGFSKRQTVLINEDGRIANTLHDINVDSQVDDILDGFGYSK